MTIDFNPVSIVTIGIFSPDHARFVTAESDGIIRFWDSVTGSILSSIRVSTATVKSLALCTNGQLVAFGASDGM
jgi:WD40 repeat protein